MNKSVSQFEPLQEMFLRSRGAPVRIGEDIVIQMDRIEIPVESLVTVEFLGPEIFADNAAVIGVPKPGEIFLSNGTSVQAVAIWDDRGLPRHATHRVVSKGTALQIYNKYRTRHDAGSVTEDSFTGNAGMVVTQTSDCCKRYECSNGPGAYSKDALIFEVRWKPYTS